MRILVGKCFGIGNAVMSVPMVRALSTLGTVDVLVGTGPDDGGALQVFISLREMGVIDRIHLENAMEQRYDVAVMSIPFDGRWREGTHFRADRVIDGRPRPDFSPALGFSSWKKHEVEYQLDNAIELGYQGETPSMQFFPSQGSEPGLVYLGLGFKRDRDAFWSTKHWGNERYVHFIRTCRELRPDLRFVTTGDAADLTQTIIPISRATGIDLCPDFLSLMGSFVAVSRCAAYFGNDTGMMHVAASMDIPTFGLMAYENVVTKNRPWCSRWEVHEFFSGSDPVRVAESFVKFMEER